MNHVFLWNQPEGWYWGDPNSNSERKGPFETYFVCVRDLWANQETAAPVSL